jgi:ABC-type enterochelin transport system substrate-binding protein
MSAHPQTADAKARANQTANQVLNHPLVQQGAAIGNDYLVKLDKSVSVL